jgi:hypothetical protein
MMFLDPVARWLDEAGAVRELLERQERHGELLPLESPEDLQLRADFATKDRAYRLTEAALLQICARLARGLPKVVQRLVGENAEVARAVFNLLVSSRFERLRGWRLVCDRAEQRIDGLVSARRTCLSNLDFFHRVCVWAQGQQMQLVEAWVGGRRLAVRFQRPEAQAVCAGLRWHRGAHFGNSDLAGVGVTAAPALLTDSPRQRFVERTADYCLAHVSGLDARLSALLDRCALAVRHVDVLRQLPERLRALEPACGLTRGDVDGWRRWRRWLARQIGNQLAAVVMRRLELAVAGGNLAALRWRHWLEALAVHDDRLPYSSQEKLQTLAYAVLLGKVQLPTRMALSRAG